MSVINKVKTVEVSEEIITYLPTVEESLSEFSREELIQRFASLEFNKFLEYYKNSQDR